jgi:hypothetical protein
MDKRPANSRFNAVKIIIGIQNFSSSSARPGASLAIYTVQFARVLSFYPDLVKLHKILKGQGEDRLPLETLYARSPFSLDRKV